ncbi:Hif prolyl hydroxylase [Favolaschia claudopus]|uniref:Hif prolyl hydroxylase n=1 Tax=Favolaschia claudopus TaxID=2862362 RepID=A0AAW0BY55_9AGAR
MPHPSLNHPCAVCNRATSLWCSRCQNAWYCSPEHMRSDWPQHRAHCHSACVQYGSNMIATPPPAEPEYISVSAILFLADEDRPRIITVKCRPPQRPSHGVCPIPMLQAYFDAPPNNVVLTQGLNGEPLRFPLHIFYSPTALSKASPINRAIYHITSGAASKPFFGNVVAFKHSGARRQGYTEATSNDLPALSAYFLSCQ